MPSPALLGLAWEDAKERQDDFLHKTALLPPVTSASTITPPEGLCSGVVLYYTSTPMLFYNMVSMVTHHPL